jgi:dienelactone hydrolase
MKRLGLLLGLVLLSQIGLPAVGQDAPGPETVFVAAGALKLRALIWRPAGHGPFPGVIFNHGSYSARDPMAPRDAAALGRTFARHGYVLLFLFRHGIGLSADQGTADGDQMTSAMAAGGLEARNRVQLELLDGAEMNEAVAGLAFLRALPDVDPRRLAVSGHSFGGSLSLLLAEREPSLRAAVVFGAAAGSWSQSPALRERLLSAVQHTAAPVLFIHTANDYSVEPGKHLAREMQRSGKSHELKIYPPFGQTSREGHNFLYRSVGTWESDVFAFLDAHLQR